MDGYSSLEPKDPSTQRHFMPLPEWPEAAVPHALSLDSRILRGWIQHIIYSVRDLWKSSQAMGPPYGPLDEQQT